MTAPIADAAGALITTAREVSPEHLRRYAGELFDHAAVTMDAAGDTTTGAYWSAVLTARLAHLLEVIADDSDAGDPL